METELTAESSDEGCELNWFSYSREIDKGDLVIRLCRLDKRLDRAVVDQNVPLKRVQNFPPLVA